MLGPARKADPGIRFAATAILMWEHSPDDPEQHEKRVAELWRQLAEAKAASNVLRPDQSLTKGTHVKIVPPGVEQRINQVDRTPSLIIGIVCALVAVGCAFSLLSTLYSAMVLSSVGWFSPVLIVWFVIYIVIGGAALIGAVGFLTHYREMGEAPPPPPAS
jgi:Flp pilus assembly protein TadB